MATKTKKELLDALLEAEGTENSGGRYIDCLVEIIGIDIIKSKKDHLHPFVAAVDEGTVLIEVKLGILKSFDEEESLRGQQTIWYGSYYTRQKDENGEPKIAQYYTFTGSDGEKVGASLIGDILHRVHEAEEEGIKQSEGKGLHKLLQFKIGIRETKDGTIFLLTERQRLKDEAWARENSSSAQVADEVSEGIEKEEEIDPDPIPF